MLIGNKEVKRGGKPYVIAEIGNNHQVNIDMALKMIKIAKEYCKVDAVKFQKRDNNILFTKEYYNKPYSEGETYGEHRKVLEFGMEEYKKIKKLCEEIDVDLIVTPFEVNSLRFLEDLGIKIYKIASSDLTNIPLIREVAKLKKPVIVSTGGANLKDIQIAYNTIKEYHNNMALLHCVAKYPPAKNEINLNIIKTLLENFEDVVIGYSGHDIGIKASLLANAMGATIIEKHFTLDKKLKGGDHKISLEPDEMKKLVEELDDNFELLGSKEKRLNDYEIPAITKLGKSIYAKKKILKGEKITTDNICLKSPAGFMSPQKYNEILGKTVKYDIEEDKPILPEDIILI